MDIDNGRSILLNEGISGQATWGVISREVTEGIVNIVEAILPAFQQITSIPDKVSIEFGLEFNTDGRNVQPILVKGVGDAHVRITLEWGQEKNH